MSDHSIGKRARAMMLLVIVFVALMDGLDGSIVNIALPTMAENFGTDTGTIAWVSVVYLVMLAGLLITFARVAKNGLIKRVLVIGLILFTVSSLFCGISTSFQMILAFRLIQGIGAAMMAAAIPMVCVKYLPAENLGLGMGVLTMGAALGFALGPAVGGIITDLVSWHWIFLINVPLGIAVIPLMLKFIPKDEGYNGKSMDFTGVVLLFSAILCGVFALERAPYSESTPLVISAAIGCILFLAAFVVIELRKEDPLLNIRVFKHWKFDSVLMAYTASNLVYVGLLYLMPFYMSICMGFSPLISGLLILISPLLTLLICVPVSRLSDRMGERRIFAIAACGILTAGCIIMVLFAEKMAIIPLLATLVCMGLMWALSGGPMASRIIENVMDESREMGSSIMTQFIYMGGAVGTALFAMLFTLGSRSGNVSFSDLSQDVFLDGFVFAAIVAAAICAVTVVLSFIVREQKKVPKD
ncbi:MAG: MFS transporter [Candidatus Methanoplasma sp.]|jgi:EmrB/QacA subfamily drug resistance transporter|nr:MFS transporter [Candidatus Methanoplasma sp.]